MKRNHPDKQGAVTNTTEEQKKKENTRRNNSTKEVTKTQNQDKRRGA